MGSSALADSMQLTISTSPPLPVALQRDGRRLFRAEAGSQVSLRVVATMGGISQEVTSTCAFTPASSDVVVSAGGVVTFASTAGEALAAVVVECEGARKIVGFVLNESEP